MKDTIYLVKETTIRGGMLDNITVEAFFNYDSALKYVEKGLKSYMKGLEENHNMEVIEDGLESTIFDNDNNSKILYSVDLMNIKEGIIPEKIYVYTEVNTYDSGEICSHALGFLTKEESKNKMTSEINNRSEEDSENYYWISDGGIEDDYVELTDEEGNVSYLECSTIYLSQNK